MAFFREEGCIEDLPSTAWKNDGGTTRTLAVEPPDADLDSFLWRVSIADITRSGSFSAFPGVDRTIMLWRGEGILLRSSSWGSRPLTQSCEPIHFRGEDDVTCELIDDSTTDLNLMARRGSVYADLQVLQTSVVISGPVDDVVLICRCGELNVVADDLPNVTLRASGFLRISKLENEVNITTVEGETAYVCATMRIVADESQW